MQGRTARLLASVATTFALATVSACGSAPAVTSGIVPGSQDGRHLTRSDFAPVVQAATLKAGSVHTVRKVTAEKKTVTITGDLTFVGENTGRMTQTVPTKNIAANTPASRSDIRLVNGVMYAYMPGVVPVGKFVKRDLHTASTRMQALCSCVFNDLQPLSMLHHLPKSLMDVEYLGMEARWGEYVGHYRLTADAKKIPGPVDDGAAHPRATRVYDIWLDSGNLIRQMTYATSLRNVDVTYSHWGQRVDVDAPAPKQIVARLIG